MCAKSNQAYRHPMDAYFGKGKIKLISLKEIKKANKKIKERKRKERKILNENGWYKR